ncbi:MAG: hypothetical protein ACE5O2_07295 [Armatimonadota bacterium]
MAHAYTPGLRVTETATLRKERRLPLPGDVKVSVGERVNAEQVIASAELPGNVRSVNVVNLLGVTPQEVPRCMIKGEGQSVQQGEIIAQSRGLLGLFKSSCASPTTGVIENVSGVTGQVLIREPPMPVEVQAYVDGTVVETLSDEGAVVQCRGALVQGIFGIGGEGRGRLRVLADGPDETLTADAIDGSCAGEVILGGAVTDAEALRRAIAVGVVAVIVGGVDDTELERFMGLPLGVGITGQEEQELTVILTEGFGRLRMMDRTFGILREREGRWASVNGATQIRAGVMRPEVIIVDSDGDGSRERTSEQFDAETSGLAVGDLVRVIRRPYFGELGKVTALPERLQAIATEARVRVLEVELEAGGRVLLPRANVELIQT